MSVTQGDKLDASGHRTAAMLNVCDERIKTVDPVGEQKEQQQKTNDYCVWISVDDRLPDEFKTVTVWTRRSAMDDNCILNRMQLETNNSYR